MTQAFNLSQLANNLNTSGQLDATDGLTGAVPVANGGTGQTSLTANAVLVGNGTGGVQSVAPSTSGNVLTSNGTSWVSTAFSGGLTGTRGQVFTSSGTFTVPSGVTSVKVTLTGGGGAGFYGGNGSTGGTSSFGGYVSASGGGGGGIASGGAGGSASGADFSFSGQSGMDISNSNTTGGACGFDGGRQQVQDYNGSYNYIAQQGMLGGIAGYNNGVTTNSASGYGNGGCSEVVGNRRSGGGSAFAIKYVTGLTAGSTITVTVGARGTTSNSTGHGTQGIVFVEW